ncbi:MAG: hypothetical protein ACO1SX_27660 [Actinomycetota bacterium]
MARLPFRFRADVLAWWLCAANASCLVLLGVLAQFDADPHGRASQIILVSRFPFELALAAGTLICGVFLLLLTLGVAFFRRARLTPVLAAFGTTALMNLVGLAVGFGAAFGCQSPQLEDFVAAKDGSQYFFLHSPPPLNGPGHYVVAERRSANPLFFVARTVGSFERGGEFQPFGRRSAAMEAAAKELWRRREKSIQKLPG